LPEGRGFFSFDKEPSIMEKLYHLFLLTCLVVTISTLVNANVKEDKAYWDRIAPVLNTTYWQQKASIAAIKNDKAYTPDPYAVSGNLSHSVNE